jgi:hypothetical protein
MSAALLPAFKAAYKKYPKLSSFVKKDVILWENIKKRLRSGDNEQLSNFLATNLTDRTCLPL